MRRRRKTCLNFIPCSIGITYIPEEEQLYNVYIYQEDEKKKLKMKMRK